jgi:hypothetical protein
MNSLIEVFRMTEISAQTRAGIILKLGDLLNHQYASNVTESLVYELVMQLDPTHSDLKKLKDRIDGRCNF